ncbi:hydrolase [Heterostelium album PN500]|uniref:Hydrolase n=1 Tax=Heterostelium pallidum (strain ATCC 26659 / Pp 5 / PN500) TaxID=670386 RepID=D3BSN7_HETP5|nr:hydrolase [Heterostelium album PN500]EFA75502.1 hydrolase [Heterostelium album PN500]|eukprot:XP_020427636.1 hydrolase [Heterostelium album PN500]
MQSNIILDSHVHLWKIERGDYGWLKEDNKELYRDFNLQDYQEVAGKYGVGGCVLVQAAPTEEETDYLLSLANESQGYVRGVVGWIDMLAPDAPAKLKEKYEKNIVNKKPMLVAIRPMLQDLDNEEWLLLKELGPTINMMCTKNIVFEALVRPNHLKHLRKFLIRYPKIKVVIDHAAKPLINGDKAAFDQWKSDIENIAKNYQNVMVKLSGFYNEVVVEAEKVGDITEYNSKVAPYIMHLVRCFTPNRLIWASDWPVHSNYEAWFKFCRDCFSTLSKGQQNDIYFANAARIYNL